MKRIATSVVCALSAAALTFAATEAHASGSKRKKLQAGVGAVGLPIANTPVTGRGEGRANRAPRGAVIPIGDRRRRGRVGGGGHRNPIARTGGHYVWRNERVWVPARYETRIVERREPDRWETRTVRVKLPDRHEWRERRVFEPGRVEFRRERYIVRSGHWERRGRRGNVRRVWCPPVYGVRKVRVQIPGRWVTRREKVCIPGGYTTKCERVRIPGCVRQVQERVLVCEGHYATKRVKVWVPVATCTPRTRLVIGGNHGGFGFSLNLSR